MVEVHIFQEGSIYFKYIPNIGKYNFEVCGQGEQMVGFKSVMAGRMPCSHEKIMPSFYLKHTNFISSRMNTCQHYTKFKLCCLTSMKHHFMHYSYT